MASREELLAQAKQIQRQKLLEQAKAIQSQKLNETDEEDKGLYETAKEKTLQGLGAAGKVLDYLGGVTRTAGAYPFVKNVSGQDVLNAFKANPLTGAQILEKAGVPQGRSASDLIPGLYSDTGDEWLKLKRGGLLDPTARGAQGLALEMATDPLGLAGEFAVKPVIRAAQASNRPLSASEKLLQLTTRPVGAGLEAAGKGTYKSAFGKLDELSRQKNKMPISDVLFNKGITGTDKTVGRKAVDLLPAYNEQRKAVLNAIDEAGIKGNLEGALQKGIDYANGLKSSRIPEEQAVGQQLLNDINTKYSSLFARPQTVTTKQVASSILDESGKPIVKTVEEVAPAVTGISAEEAQRLKTLAGQGLPKEAWDKLSPAAQDAFVRGQKIQGAGLKNEVERMAGSLSPEVQQGLQQINAEQAALINAAKKLNANALSSYNKKLVTPVDAITYSMGSLGDEAGRHSGGLTALALKKAADLYKTTWGRTNAGLGMYNLGNYGDQLLRRPSIWQDLYNKYNIDNQEEE